MHAAVQCSAARERERAGVRARVKRDVLRHHLRAAGKETRACHASTTELSCLLSSYQLTNRLLEVFAKSYYDFGLT